MFDMLLTHDSDASILPSSIHPRLLCTSSKHQPHRPMPYREAVFGSQALYFGFTVEYGL